jgi:phospholipid/cholesterol/gamma-HCH transport system substrate-binding protein
METRSNHILVGGVVLALVVALLAFIIWMTQAGGAAKKEYDVYFSQAVDGLADGSTVTFSGVPVGQVASINLEPQSPEFVRVRISVKDDTPILQGTTAMIEGVGFTGVSQIQLDGAVKGAPPITQPGPHGVPVIPTKAGGLGAILNTAPELLQRLSTLTQRLTELLSDRNQASIASILDNVKRTSDAIADRSPEIAATLAEARVTLRQAGDAIEHVGQLAGTTDQLLNEQGKPMVADLRKTIQAAETSMNNLDKVLSDARPGVQAMTKQTIPEIGQLVRDLRDTSDALRSITTRIDQQGATSILSSPKLPDYKK